MKTLLWVLLILSSAQVQASDTDCASDQVDLSGGAIQMQTHLKAKFNALVGCIQAKQNGRSDVRAITQGLYNIKVPSTSLGPNYTDSNNYLIKNNRALLGIYNSLNPSTAAAKQQTPGSSTFALTNSTQPSTPIMTRKIASTPSTSSSSSPSQSTNTTYDDPNYKGCTAVSANKFSCPYSKFDFYTSSDSCEHDCMQCAPKGAVHLRDGTVVTSLINLAANAEDTCSGTMPLQSSKYGTPACSNSKTQVDNYEKVCGKYMLTSSQSAAVKAVSNGTTAKSKVAANAPTKTGTDSSTSTNNATTTSAPNTQQTATFGDVTKKGDPSDADKAAVELNQVNLANKTGGPSVTAKGSFNDLDEKTKQQVRNGLDTASVLSGFSLGGDKGAKKEDAPNAAPAKGSTFAAVVDADVVGTKGVITKDADGNSVTSSTGTYKAEDEAKIQLSADHEKAGFFGKMFGNSETHKDKNAIQDAQKERAGAESLKDGVNGHITSKDDAKGPCGHYDGARCQDTDTANMAVQVSDVAGQMVGTYNTTGAGTKAQAAYAAKGYDATIIDSNTAQIETLKAGENAIKTQMRLQGIGAGIQAWRLIKHSNSEKDVAGTANAARDANTEQNYLHGNGGQGVQWAQLPKTVRSQYSVEIQKAALSEQVSTDDEGNNIVGCKRAIQAAAHQLSSDDMGKESNIDVRTEVAFKAVAGKTIPAKDTASYDKCLANLKRASNTATTAAITVAQTNIAENRVTELTQQQEAVKTQAANVLASGQKIAGNAISVQNIEGQIAGLNAQNADAAAHFAFSAGTTGATSGDLSAMPTPDTGALVNDQSAAADGSLGGLDQFNPGMGGGVANSPAGAFVAAPAGPNAPAAAGGVGNAGATSAAKDDSAKTAKEENKSQAGGTYGAGDGATPTGYARAGGGSGSGVGIDGGFADLLKKFLPGGEDDKAKQAGIAFDLDRSPASQNATVMDKNKNIFFEIHKRYQQKNTEGAIVFSGKDV